MLNLALLLLGAIQLIFRKPIGNFLWACHHPDGDASRPPMKEGYPYIVGGVGGALIGLSLVMFFVERLPTLPR